jgi:rifampicin phosphotransferase
MNHHDQHPTVVPLDDSAADLERAGGKGASLARLARAGVAVPPGFCVTTDAYRRFVADARLHEPVLQAVAETDPAEPDSLRRAAERIAALFRSAPMPGDLAEAIRRAYRDLGGGQAAVAVRSSATAEDLPEHSFAGQQETFLNVEGEQALVEAVRGCWASLWTDRAIAYRARVGIAPGQVALAVVVQELVPADAAGVVFTADPVTGARARMTRNAAWGLGEAVVSGAVTSDALVVDRGTGRLVERLTGHKSVMTVRSPGGTQEEPVPEHLRERQVLDDGEAEELARQCVRIEELYDTPVDIEWARHEGRMHILQARPITTTAAPAGGVAPEVWNDSLEGDFLWTSANVGEAVPSVMTPISWAMFKRYVQVIKPVDRVRGITQFGNIGGRLYMNLSSFTLAGQKVERFTEQITGELPEGVEIPPMPARRRLLLRALPVVLPTSFRFLRYARRVDDHLAQIPVRLAAARRTVRAARTPAELAERWAHEIDPTLVQAALLCAAGGLKGGLALGTFRPWMRKHGVSEADINALSSGSGENDAFGGPMASLGPLVGLAQLARGEIDRDTFAERWGHRCPDEFELSVPRPAEDPEWLDRQLAGMGEAMTQVDDLLQRQRSAREEALARFAERHPDKLKKLHRRMAASAQSFWYREAGRSAWVRSVRVQRDFVLRAGELTGRGEDMFFLNIEEILAVLRGDDTPLTRVPARRAAYDHYRALPAYPAFIRGRFDPERWATDPNRRVDVYDEFRDLAPAGAPPRGAPGAAGVVEATARVVGSPEEGDALRPGEILVTSVTNVGWTPLFPRAAAVVTDVGAPLSHAAIVARELGIPAVVGCGDATTRLATGDLIRVDGAQGTVEVVASADALAVDSR